MLSFLHPTPLSLTTPPELRPYGWTTTDLWCAPLITGLYALLTHAQPFWADLHVLISELLTGYQGQLNYKIQTTAEPLDPELARVICAVLLAGMFVTRTAKNFAVPLVINIQEKEKPRAPPKALSNTQSSVSEKSSPPSIRPPSTRSQCTLNVAIVIL